MENYAFVTWRDEKEVESLVDQLSCEDWNLKEYLALKKETDKRLLDIALKRLAPADKQLIEALEYGLLPRIHHVINYWDKSSYWEKTPPEWLNIPYGSIVYLKADNTKLYYFHRIACYSLLGEKGIPATFVTNSPKPTTAKKNGTDPLLLHNCLTDNYLVVWLEDIELWVKPTTTPPLGSSPVTQYQRSY